MKGLLKTGIIIAAAAGIMVVTAASASAEILGPGNGGPLVSMQAQTLPTSGEEYIVPPEEEPGLEVPVGEEPGLPVEVVDEPPADNPGDQRITQEQTSQQPVLTAETAPVTVTRMPETGVNMVSIAALCLGLTAASFGVRRFGMRYSL